VQNLEEAYLALTDRQYRQRSVGRAKNGTGFKLCNARLDLATECTHRRRLDFIGADASWGRGLSLGCVGADRPARIQTGSESGGLGRTKDEDGAAYVMPGWAGRIASAI